MPSFELLQTRNTARLDGTYKDDLSGDQAWKGRKSKGMERLPADATECVHVLRFSLISKLDCTKVCPPLLPVSCRCEGVGFLDLSWSARAPVQRWRGLTAARYMRS